MVRHERLTKSMKRTDTQRLNWLNKNPHRVVHAQGYHGSESGWSYSYVKKGFGGVLVVRKTLRAAIDGAMDNRKP